MAIVVEVVLVNGERRTVSLPGHTGSLANALARLDDWILTDDGSWVQKSFIVEVRGVDREGGPPRGSAVEFERLSEAAGTLAGQGRGSKDASDAALAPSLTTHPSTGSSHSRTSR